MAEVRTYAEMNEKIVGILRLSDLPVDLYAAQRIEELEKEKTEAYNRGVKDGADLAAMHASDATSQDREKSFWEGAEIGAARAWEAARKIYQFDPVDNVQLCKKLFDCFYGETISKYSATEVMKALREYETQEKASNEQIKVGDEVTVDGFGGTAVVTYLNDDYTDRKAALLFYLGGVEYLPVERCHKTGREYPQVAELLIQMRDNIGKYTAGGRT